MREIKDPAFAVHRRAPAAFAHDSHNQKAGIDDCSVCHHGGTNGVLDRQATSEGTPCSDCHPVTAAQGVTPLNRAWHRQCMLLGSTAHGIKGLLTALDGGIYRLGYGLAHDKRNWIEEGFADVQHLVGRIKKMVLDILYYAKKRELAWKRLSVAAFAAEVAAIARPKAEARGIAFVTDIPADAGEFEADAEAVTAGLVNILENAVDACAAARGQGPGHIDFTVRPLKNTVEFVVADTGIGMRVRQWGTLAQISGHLRQSTRNVSPSRMRTTSPTVTSAGGLARRWPPLGPRTLTMIPAFLSCRMIFSRYFWEMSWCLAISRICTGPFLPCKAISRTILVPYRLAVRRRMRATEGQPLVLRWAKALKHIAENITVYIDDNQLLAGRAGCQGRYGILYPELDGDFLDVSIRDLPNRSVSPFSITPEDAKIAIEDIAPYWKGKTYHVPVRRVLRCGQRYFRLVDRQIRAAKPGRLPGSGQGSTRRGSPRSEGDQLTGLACLSSGGILPPEDRIPPNRPTPQSPAPERGRSDTL